MTNMLQAWTRAECHQCGMTYQVTRSEPRPEPKEFLCGECSAYNKGYNEGIEQSLTLEKIKTKIIDIYDNKEDFLKCLQEIEDIYNDLEKITSLALARSRLVSGRLGACEDLRTPKGESGTNNLLYCRKLVKKVREIQPERKLGEEIWNESMDHCELSWDFPKREYWIVRPKLSAYMIDIAVFRPEKDNGPLIKHTFLTPHTLFESLRNAQKGQTTKDS